MTESAIQNIYNKLLNWEGKNASQSYPIHKKLNTIEFGFNDIYEWISKTYEFNTNTKVLDAGCGVGYGSIYLSKRYDCVVNGITLSDAEVKKASEFAKRENIENNVSFKQQSFDDLQPNSFDFIMAIESVKHTLNLDKSLYSLKSALKPNGILVIVDDVLINKNHKPIINKYAKDWVLKVLLKYNHFTSEFSLKKDLTHFVKPKNSLMLSTGILIFSILKPFYKIASIMRGGLYLEKLFKQKIMKYYVLEYKKL